MMVLIFRWILNVVLFSAAVICFVIAATATHDTIFNRAMTVSCGIGFAIFCAYFVRSTLPLHK